MKPSMLILLWILAATAFGQIGKRVRLIWGYHWPDVTNTAFRVYASTNAIKPLPWRLAAQTSLGTTQCDMPATELRQFFYVTATNGLGESLPARP